MTSKLIAFLFCMLSALGWTMAQQLEMASLKDIKPRNIGPAGMSGRVTSIDVDLSDSDIIYVGTASGGVWKSTNGGINFQPIFDEQEVIAIGAVAVNQKNPSDIWVGTGEGNPRNSHNSGGGIYRSLDGGKNWTLMGLEKTMNIHRILIHRDNPEIVYVAALGSIWGENPERGVYRTTDGGKSWEQVLYVNESTGCADLVVDPANPNKLIAAMWEFGRKPWTFNSGGKGSGMYVTHDGGENWDQRTDDDGLPTGDLGRIGLAIAPSKPSVIYALVEAKENALYKSTDGGFTWNKHSTDDNIGNRPFYYSDIFVDSKNENRVYSLFSYVTRSEDGGKTFQVLLPYSGVHPDHHAFWVHPDDPSYIIEGNDGGLNISRDGGANWRFIPNLPLAQFYHINYDMDFPYNVGGGMQDNGSWIGPSQVWQSGGITNSHWQEIFFGDGFDVVFRPDNNRYAYAMSQEGSVGMVDRETGYTKAIVPTHPDKDIELRFNWNAAIAQDPFNDCGVYFGSQFVHYSTDCGDSWDVLSPDLTTNDTSKQKQDKSGGLTIDATGAENYTTILAIAPSPVDKNVIWVGTDDGNLQLTQDKGKTWTNLAGRLPGAKAGSWIPFIEVSPKNAGEAFVIVNDYRRNDFRPMAYHTTDFGKNWTRIVDEKQVRGYAQAIVQDPEEPNLLFLGTDNGLYISVDGAKNWTRWTNGYPAVSTIDMKIHPREQDLIIATFGRAAWILDDIRPLREIARTKGAVLEQPLAVFDAPDAYLAARKSYLGVRFGADGHYSGENRRGGAMLTIWRKAMKQEDKKGGNKEEASTDTGSRPGRRRGGSSRSGEQAKVYVLDNGGDTIRTFGTRLDTGMNRIYWPLNRDGVEYPSRQSRRPDADPPSGPSVLPGTYKVIVSMGKFKDSTMVEVKADPRLPFTIEQMQAKDAAYREFEAVVEKATAGFENLKEARAAIKRVNGALVNAPDSLQKKAMKMGKELEKKIAELEELYMTPEGLKGIQGSSDNLRASLFSASGYITRSSDGAPNQGAQRMLKRAKEHTAEVLEKVNAFISGDFKKYHEMVESINYSLFSEMETVQMDE